MIRKGFTVLCLILGLTLSALPRPAHAFGAGSFDTTVSPIGSSCTFNLFHDFASQETQVNFSVPGLTSQSAGGNYWRNGQIEPWPGGDILAADVASQCGLSNVTNFVSDGANGDYATDAFMGVSFRATLNSDGNTYDYRIGVTGAASTSPVNTRLLVAPPPNTPPTADAGPDQTVASGATGVALDGTGSSDPDPAQMLSYTWRQTAGTNVTLSSTSAAAPTFDAPVRGVGAGPETLTFELIVNDGLVDSAPDTVDIVVNAAPDTTRPTAAITGLPASFTGATPFDVTITFSEVVTGFAAGDIDASNATVTALTGGGASYTAQITPSGMQDIALQIPDGVAQDNAGNPNLASARVTISSSTVELAEERIVDALTDRGRALIGAQPKLRGFMVSPGASGFSADVTRGRGLFNLELNGDSPFWVRASGRWSTIDGSDSQYFHLAVGGHIYRSETLFLGAQLQIDRSEIDFDDSDFEGEGWLIGPYLVAKLPNQPLYFSASVLYGQTENQLTLDGFSGDDFSTERMLITAGVEGRYMMPSGLTLIPAFDLAHVVDRQDSYTDSQSNKVSAQTIRLTEASFGLGFEQPMQIGGRDMRLTGGLSGIHSNLDAPGQSERSSRGRIDIGADIILGPRATLKLNAHYDGIGAPDFDAHGADIAFVMTF